MSFEAVWNKVQAMLRPGTAVRKWTAYSGYLGGSFTIVAVDNHRVQVDSPGARNIQMVPRRDFEAVYDLWQGYLAGSVRRYQLRDRTRFSKYIISIIHHVEEGER